MAGKFTALSGAGLMLAAVAGSASQSASAQSLGYGSVSGADGGSGGGSAAAGSDGAGVSGPHDSSGKLPGGGHSGKRERLKITPYIEALQVISADLSPGDAVLTWSALAAGVDGNFQGRRSEGTFSVRYEHGFGWGRAEDRDVISGLARGGVTIVPQAVSLEAGALATRTSVDVNGASLPGSFDQNRSTHLYSLYAGPNLSTHAGDVAVTGTYRIGYTEVGSNQLVAQNAQLSNVDVFDHSVTHNAELHAGTRAGEILPVGLGAGVGYYQEDVSNLDQQVKDFHARLDATLPVSGTVALVGGIGYEDVTVSSRDVLRDASGAPVIGSDGRWVTDGGAPRQIAYDTSGFIWDAGVTWRPSRRTALEAHVGRRYGSTTYYGSFGWRATRRSSVNISVYDNIAGFGGQFGTALAELPRDFDVLRDPVSGDVISCVSSLEQGSCLTSAFGAVRSAVFRARGVQASYALQVGRFGTGIAAGYDRRKFIAAPGTILAGANGRIDENTWLSAWFNGRIDRDSSFSTTIYADWYRTDFIADGDGTALGATATYGRAFGQHISANAAISIQGIQRRQVDDYWNASAVLGVRYSF